MAVDLEWRHLDDALQNLIDEGSTVGLVALVTEHGRVRYLGNRGRLSLESPAPIPPSAIFRIASMLKPITAVAVMILHEEGHFGLDDPIAAFIPEYGQVTVADKLHTDPIGTTMATRPITIRHLLTHTSGIVLGSGAVDPLDALAQAQVGRLISTPGTTLQGAVRTLATMPLAFQPGDGWRYGLSFEVLAALVEIVSGQWFDRFLHDRIFVPLQMHDSGYVVAPDKVDRFASLYKMTAAGQIDLMEAAGDSPHVLFHDFEPGSVWTSGGSEILSTAPDYTRFARMLLNYGTLDDVRLLSRRSVEMMTTIQWRPTTESPTNGPPPGFGQGLALRVLTDSAQAGFGAAAGSFGHDGGHGTSCWIDPALGLTAVLMTQIDPIPSKFHLHFQRLTYQTLSRIHSNGAGDRRNDSIP